ncbi:MAG: FtsX-like permease family protein [Pseudomonadota bacterium]
MIFKLAYKYLRSSRRGGVVSLTAGFSMVGIMLGVAALIVVMAVMTGYRQEILRLTTSFNGHLTLRFDRGHGVDDNLINDMQQIEGVTSVNRQIERQVMISTEFVNQGANFIGLDSDSLNNDSIVKKSISLGNLSKFSKDNKVVVIGGMLANQIGVGVGDKIKLITTATNRTFVGRIPRTVELEVIAVYNSGTSLYDSINIYSPIGLVQQIFRLGDRADQLVIRVTNPDNMSYYQDYFQVVYPDFRVMTWQQANSGLIKALEIEKIVMFIVLTLIITVAAFNIIASLSMLVNFKRKEIAILRTIGMSARQIMICFALTGVMIGVIGTSLGVLVGCSFANNIESIRQFLMSMSGVSLFDPLIYYLDLLPAAIITADVVKIGAMSLFLSLLAALYPAFQAARLNPAMVVKYD